MFPFLDDPLWMLLFELSIPFVAVILIGCAVGVGSMLVSILESRDRKNKIVDLMNGDTSQPLLSTGTKEISVEYPAMALLTSLSITATKFLYFGTALAAHQYLFSSTQASTGVVYTQNSPWLRYAEAGRLIAASIPALLIFDLVLPVLFLVLCWKVRKYYSESSVQIYFGSLFETYSRKCFWWEIVTTLKKLTIALVLKSFSNGDAIQSALIVSILLGIQVIQVTVNPWRRKTENASDAISAALLCGALLSTRPGQLSHVSGVTWYIFALSCVFVIGNVVIVIWQTIVGTTDYEKRLVLALSNTELGRMSVQALATTLQDSNTDAEESSDQSIMNI